MFAIIAVVGVRVARTSDDLFVKLATGGLLAWIIGQALINIGAVLGLLPITGLPLPMVSYGGSSLLMCLCAIGIRWPSPATSRETAAALRARRGDDRTRLITPGCVTDHGTTGGGRRRGTAGHVEPAGTSPTL